VGYQVAHFSELGFRCIAYDRRGHGRSDIPAGGFDMDTLADDMAAVVDQLALRDVTLVGHSQGGAEAIHYLARHGSAGCARPPCWPPPPPICSSGRQPLRRAAGLFRRPHGRVARDFPKWIADNKAPFFTPETSPAMQDWMAGLLLATPVPVAIADFKALLKKDLRPDLAKIDRPTLILHGTKGRFYPPGDLRPPPGRRHQGRRAQGLEGAPHGLFVTHLEQVNRDLEAFIRA